MIAYSQLLGHKLGVTMNLIVVSNFDCDVKTTRNGQNYSKFQMASLSIGFYCGKGILLYVALGHEFVVLHSTPFKFNKFLVHV